MREVRKAQPEDVDGCVVVLAALPDFFTPDTHDEVRTGWAAGPAWVALVDGATVGFLLVSRRDARSAEITYAAVLPQQQGSGIGTELVDTALDELRSDGVLVVEVKTLDASSGYAPYEATRAFWERRGFVQVDCIDPLPGWQPGNPSAIYVAALSATR